METTTDARAVRSHESAPPDWETAKKWAKAAFAEERMTEVGVGAATLVLTCYLGAVLLKGIQTYSMSGF